MKTYVLNNDSTETLEYGYAGETYYLAPGDTSIPDFSHAQHALAKLQCRGVTLREE